MNQKTFTEADMQYCFEQSRLTHPMVGFKYDTFEDFKSAVHTKKRLKNFNEFDDKRYEIEVIKKGNKFWEIGERAIVYEHIDRDHFVLAKDYHFLISKDCVRIIQQLPDAI